MRRGAFLAGAMAWAVASAALAGLGARPSEEEDPVRGSIAIPEISGAAIVAGRLLVAADDPYPKKTHNLIAWVKGAIKRKEEPAVDQAFDKILPSAKGAKAPIDDIEDIAYDGARAVYFVTSSSKPKPERRRILRVKIDPRTKKWSKPVLLDVDAFDALPSDLRPVAVNPPNKKDDAGAYIPGLNIEGAACAPNGDLILGLRSPTRGGHAVLLRIGKSVLKAGKPGVAIVPKFEAELDLGGRGVRGMCYDPVAKGFWLIAGLSPDPDDGEPNPPPNDWEIYLWKHDGKLVRKKLPPGTDLPNPEAVCVLSQKGRPRSLLLISDDGDAAGKSGFLILPIR